jgi:hypothetical protein
MDKTLYIDEDVSSIVLLEHVNLSVPDGWAASVFYFEGLGLTRDPYDRVGPELIWCNIGWQQIHLPVKKEPDLLSGHIGLVMPNLAEMIPRLRAVAPALQNTKFSWKLCTPPHPKRLSVHVNGFDRKQDSYLWVRDPVGNIFRIFENSNKISYRGGLGIAYIEELCRRGTAEDIALFYKKFFNTFTTVEECKEDINENEDEHGFSNENSNINTNDNNSNNNKENELDNEKQQRNENRKDKEVEARNTKLAKVVVGPKQLLVFRETDKQIKYTGYHVAIYINTFSQIYNRIAENNLLYKLATHRLSEKYNTLEEATQIHQFRFSNIVRLSESRKDKEVQKEETEKEVKLENGDKGNEGGLQKLECSKQLEVLHVLEHEVRSLHHPSFMRPLVNRVGTAGIYCRQ